MLAVLVALVPVASINAIRCVNCKGCSKFEESQAVTCPSSSDRCLVSSFPTFFYRISSNLVVVNSIRMEGNRDFHLYNFSADCANRCCCCSLSLGPSAAIDRRVGK